MNSFVLNLTLDEGVYVRELLRRRKSDLEGQLIRVPVSRGEDPLQQEYSVVDSLLRKFK